MVTISGGELTSVTNPWGAQVGYDYDNTGRLTNVSGSGYAAVSNYASGLNYGAWGSLKSMNYGDQQALSTAYDNRMRADDLERLECFGRRSHSNVVLPILNATVKNSRQ